MNDIETPIEMLFGKAEDYGKTTLKLLKLNAVDKSSDLISSLTSMLIVAVVFFLSILTVSVGSALWIGEQLGKSYYGFFIISGFYILVTLLLYSFRKQWIKIPFNNYMISKMLKTKSI